MVKIVFFAYLINYYKPQYRIRVSYTTLKQEERGFSNAMF